MTRYVALLRGIGPMNPNMRNEKLRELFESLGFTHVRTVISSGNVLFEAQGKTPTSLERIIEQALPRQLGFTSTTIVRSQRQLQQILRTNPFAGLTHGQKTYLTVTFLKHRPGAKETNLPETTAYTVLRIQGRAIYSVVDLNNTKTPQLMTWLEKQYGKEITTRTWKTVERITKGLSYDQ